MKEAAETFSKLLVEGAEGPSADNAIMGRVCSDKHISFVWD